MSEPTNLDEIRKRIEDTRTAMRCSCVVCTTAMYEALRRTLAALDTLWGSHASFLHQRGLYDAEHVAHEHILAILLDEGGN
ncbi:hypothetical protein LCGC14_2482470 [marine sediment metagenome]|uniref:Uncharacterized protein n=1 Tax=marine sediment metagenome TaxID=412755 RepID=A0A0F9B765_9ZZZZ